MMTLDIDKHAQLRELIEDSVEYWCDEHLISGELAYIVVETIAEAKLMQFRGLIK